LGTKKKGTKKRQENKDSAVRSRRGIALNIVLEKSIDVPVLIRSLSETTSEKQS